MTLNSVGFSESGRTGYLNLMQIIRYDDPEFAQAFASLKRGIAPRPEEK